MKTIEIKVIANAKKSQVTESGDKLKVKVMAPAVEGKANEAVVKLLASYLNVKPRQIKMVKGERNSHKTIEVND